MRFGTKRVNGLDVKVGDKLVLSASCAPDVIAKVEAMRHPMGAKFQRVWFEHGGSFDCWDGFNYSILVPIQA